MANVPAPFSATFTPNFPELLNRMNCTLALTTYQAGKVLFLSAADEERLSMLPRTFKKPMGMALNGDRLAVATTAEVTVLQNARQLAVAYPPKPQTYDALFLPRATYYTGPVDVHDLHWGNDGLYAVNTLFSCLCQIDDSNSFTPVWRPPFIDALVAEDRCHLNGLAMRDGAPAYVTALGSGNTKQSWRENIVEGGIVMDVTTNRIVARGLAMPHTPRLWDGKLYVLLSATGSLVRIDPEDGSSEEIINLDCFVRGMAKLGDYVFVATSKLRKNSSTFRQLAIADRANEAGVIVLHLPTRVVVSKLTFQMSVDEIYDVQILPEVKRPNIINTYGDKHLLALTTPETAFWSSKREPKG